MELLADLLVDRADFSLDILSDKPYFLLREDGETAERSDPGDVAVDEFGEELGDRTACANVDLMSSSRKSSSSDMERSKDKRFDSFPRMMEDVELKASSSKTKVCSRAASSGLMAST